MTAENEARHVTYASAVIDRRYRLNGNDTVQLSGDQNIPLNRTKSVRKCAAINGQSAPVRRRNSIA